MRVGIKRPPRILPAIIFTQFAGTSLWFAGNAVLVDLQRQLSLGDHVLGYMTSAVQLGFIVGTLFFALFAVSDRFSPRIVFFICSLLGASSNGLICLVSEGLASLLLLRFVTGFFLAGIYPVGMKIAAGWYQQGLGKALGFLVGAVVLGTAFPHLLKGMTHTFQWENLMFWISGMALAGGILMLLLVPDGPFLVKNTRFQGKAIRTIFQSMELRSAAFGYFGHMWELYAFWAFIPFILLTYIAENPGSHINISFWAFCIIACGSLGCAAGGMISKRLGSAQVAFFQLAASGLCCLFSPVFYGLSKEIFFAVLLFWGIMVVGDSPQFSTLVARTAPQELVGSAMTIVNCIGFLITILSIQLLNYLFQHFSANYLFIILTVGPVFGLLSLWPLLQKRPIQNNPV
ncbi:MAG TPA: MFS transporter [Deltaproteobacteria bacterium]|nr:MFS transporter [Deltaproteobacteria bacterium]